MVVKKDAKIANCRGDYGADEIKLPLQSVPCECYTEPIAICDKFNL